MNEPELMIEASGVWETPLYFSNFPAHERLKPQLIEHLYQLRQQDAQTIASEVAVNAKRGLFESDLDLLNEMDPQIQELRAFLEQLIATVAEDVNQEYWPDQAQVAALITESWCHITQKGGYHDAHSHPNCSWCGIYYLESGDCDFENRSGVNRFYDPRVNADHYFDAGAQYLNSHGVWDIEPVDGQIVIFPSYLKHSALPYLGENDRIVIAFNAQVDFV